MKLLRKQRNHDKIKLSEKEKEAAAIQKVNK